jgi:hypothetical protein
MSLIKLKCFPLYPQSIVVKEYGPRALEASTCHILGGQALNNVIRKEIQSTITYLINQVKPILPAKTRVSTRWSVYSDGYAIPCVDTCPTAHSNNYPLTDIMQ